MTPLFPFLFWFRVCSRPLLIANRCLVMLVNRHSIADSMIRECACSVILTVFTCWMSCVCCIEWDVDAQCFCALPISLAAPSAESLFVDLRRRSLTCDTRCDCGICVTNNGSILKQQLLCVLTDVVSTSAIDCRERFISEMTYYVSSGTINPTHSLTHSQMLHTSGRRLYLYRWRQANGNMQRSFLFVIRTWCRGYFDFECVCVTALDRHCVSWKHAISQSRLSHFRFSLQQWHSFISSVYLLDILLI